MTLQKLQTDLSRLKRKLPAPDSSVGLWILGLAPLALGILAAITGITFLHSVAIIIAFMYFHYDGKKQGVEEYRKTLYRLSEYRKGIVASRDAHKAFRGTLRALGKDSVGAAQVAYDTIAEKFTETMTPNSAKAFVHYHNRQRELREARNESKARTSN